MNSDIKVTDLWLQESQQRVLLFNYMSLNIKETSVLSMEHELSREDRV